MQHRVLYFSISLFTLLFAAACGCPPDEEIGQIGLSETARNFLPYDGTETLLFADETGNTIRFTAPRGKEEGTDQVCIRTICTEARFNSPSSCEYFEADNLRFVFVSEDQERLIDLLVYTLLYQRDTENFYDALQVSYAFGPPSFVADWLIETRFSGTIDVADTPLDNLMSFEEEIMLRGKSYTEVLHFRQNELGIYLQAGKGVIALEEGDQLWLLQE